MTKENNIFAEFILDATIQDGGMKERSDLVRVVNDELGFILFFLIFLNFIFGFILFFLFWI